MKTQNSGPICGCFKDVKSKQAIGKNCSLISMLKYIKSGRWKAEIDAIRSSVTNELAPDGVESKANALKSKLPAFMMSTTTTSRKHRLIDCAGHTGVVQIDVDKIGRPDAEAARARLAGDRHILAAWISPSGNGLKIAVRVEASKDTHGRAWRQAAAYVQDKYQLKSDEAPKALNALCFVSFDPEMVLREWDETDPLPEENTGEIAHSNSGNSETQVTQETQKHRGSVEVVICDWDSFDIS